MKGWVTINTDAGFYPYDKVGSYAYWIKGDNLFLKGSGIFKEQCNNSLEAETKAIINALHLLIATKRTDFTKIVFNRDNINAKPGKHLRLLQPILDKKLNALKSQCNFNGKKFYMYRHVKAHTHTDTAKHWVNDWLDKQCKQELRKWKSEQQKPQS